MDRCGGGPYNSFANILTRADISKFDDPLLRRMMDPHFPSADLSVLENELRKNAKKKVDMRFPDIHQKWLQVCRQDECSKEQAFESWEGPINTLRVTALSNWYSATGWQVYSAGGYVSPAAELYFVKKLEPQSTSYLTIRFGAGKVDVAPDVQSPNHPGAKVDPADIHSGNLMTALKYRPWQTMVLLASLVAIVVFPFFKSKPIEKRPAHELVNLALEADRKDPRSAMGVWDLVYSLIRKDITESFEKQRAHAGRPVVWVPAGQLFDYIRNCLRTDYGLNDRRYETNEELDEYVHGCLGAFATI